MTPGNLQALRLQGADFLQWWLGELRAMLPRRHRQPRGVVSLLGDTPSIARVARGEMRVIAPLSPQEPVAGQGRALRALAAQDEIVMVVPPAWVLRRVLQLPAAAEARLDAVLGFEIEQHVPFAVQDMLWCARVLRRLPEARRIEVEVAVLPRGLIAPAAMELRRKARTARLVARPERSGEWPSVSLDPVAPPRVRWRRRIEAALSLLAAALALQLGWAELRQQGDAVAAVEARAAGARAAAERVMALEAETAALRTRLAAAAELRGGRPPGIAIIEELALRLPDDVWLTELRLVGDQLLLSGFAARADALLELLDASAMFQQSRFTAPVTRGSNEAAERFQVALRVAPAAGRAADVVRR